MNTPVFSVDRLFYAQPAVLCHDTIQVTITRLAGCIEIYSSLGDGLVTRNYIGYSPNEALAEFVRELLPHLSCGSLPAAEPEIIDVECF